VGNPTKATRDHERARLAGDFGAALRARRLKARLTQEELADRTGLLHFSEISRLERGVREPGLLTIVLLARALELKPGQLLKDIS
jgi:transcriptional regulator with XRE-family HTH domain